MFQNNLSAQLALLRVTAPMVVLSGTGLNDELNGVERPVRFPIKDMDERQAEVVHSLAKWKRAKLAQLGIAPGRGIYTDMNALRPDEELDNIHSIYVDQWDWEKVIRPQDRHLGFLKQTVRRIYEAIKVTENKLFVEFPQIAPELPEDIHFVHAEELVQLYPGRTPKEREHEIVRRYGAVFIIGIGGKLSNGEKHDGRAADYDDWSSPNEEGFKGLNGDILVWNHILQRPFELSSMGIRVDAAALHRQLEIRGELHKENLPFHRSLLDGELPADHRRRNRTEQTLHVPAAQGPHRRDPEQHLAGRDGPPLRRGRHQTSLGIFPENPYICSPFRRQADGCRYVLVP